MTITDNRNGKTYEIPIQNNKLKKCTENEVDTIKAIDLSKINLRYLKILYKIFIFRIYDPGYFNTASATSKITYIDGDRGILLYRGYENKKFKKFDDFFIKKLSN